MKLGVLEAKSIDEVIKENTVNSNDIKYGGRIILPQIVLEKCTTRANMPFPLIFKLKLNNEEVCCGVHSFEAKPGEVFITDWIKNALKIQDYKQVTKIEVWALTKPTPKGTSALFQAQSMDFLDFTNPKAILERSLRSYTCLGKDQIITIWHNNKVLRLKICKSEPQELILITDCDLSVDFMAPPGYVEPIRQPAQSVQEPTTPEYAGKRCDGKPLSTQQKSQPTMRRVIPTGIPDFDYKLGSIKLDRRQMVKEKTKEMATAKAVATNPSASKAVGAKPTPRGNGLVERPPGQRPVTRSQTKARRTEVPNDTNQWASTSRNGQDQDSPEPMDVD